MKRIVWGDSIDAYIERNNEETIIRQEIEAAAEEGILNEKELEELQEEMLDELYNKEYKEDESIRKNAFKVIAANILKAADEALENGEKAKAIKIGEVYNDWIEICKKEGVL